MKKENNNKPPVSGIGQIYSRHHVKGKRIGSSIFKDTRGNFLKDKIGVGKKVLDLGCRDGVLTEQYCEGNNVLGIDVDINALNILEKRLGVSSKYMDINGDWNIPGNSFDVVVAGEVLEHLYYPKEVVRKIAQVLRNDGVLLGSVPNAFSLINRIRLFLGDKDKTPLHDPTHINHFSLKELKRIMEEYFYDVKIHPLGKFSFLDKIWPGMFSFMFLFEAENKKPTKQNAITF